MKTIVQLYRHYILFMQKRRWVRWLGWFLVLLAAIPVTSIEVENKLEEWFPDDSEIVKQNQQFVEDFGHDEWMFYYLVFPENQATQEKINIVAQVSDSLRNIHGLRQVFARSDIKDFVFFLDSGQRSLLERVDSMYFDTRNGRGEMVYLRLESTKTPNDKRHGILDSIKRKTAFLPDTIETHLTGSGVIFSEIDRLSKEDGGLLISLAFLFMIVILTLRISSRKRLFIILLLLMLCFLPAISLYGWTGIKVNMVNMVIPMLFIILFGAYLLHLTSKSDGLLRHYLNIKVAPVCLAAITTIIGLGSLIISEFPIISQFGVIASGGLAIGLFLLLILGIPEIRAIPGKKAFDSHGSKLDSFVYHWLFRFYAGLSTWRTVILTAFAAIIMFSGVYFFSEIKVDTNSLTFLPKDNKVRQDVYGIEESFGYFNPLDLVLKKKQEPWEKQDWQNLKELRQKLAQFDFVDGMVGFDQWFAINHPLVTKNARPLFLSEDSLRTRMMVRIPMGSTVEMKKYYNQTLEVIRHFSQNHNYEINSAGYLPIYLYQMEHIVSGMLYNLGLAIVLILMLILLIIRDWKLGLISLFLNIFPLLVLSLVMFIFNIPFDISTAVIACVVIGIVVDDSLHILWYYRQGSLQEKETSLIFSGYVLPYVRPIMNSTLIFGLGFLVLLFSRLRSIENMGLLCSVALFVAWIADVLIFPAVLKLFKKYLRKE